MITIQNLNSTWWYRLIKISFIFISLLTLISVNILFWNSNYDNSKFDSEKVKDFILKSREAGISDEDIFTYLKSKGLDLNNRIQTEFDFFSALTAINLSVLFVIEIIRRIFYYIVLGSFFPKKRQVLSK